MITEQIGGRKFIAYLLTMLGWLILLAITVKNGLTSETLIQTFLTVLIVVQGIFFGGNLVEKWLDKMFTNKKGESDQ